MGEACRALGTPVTGGNVSLITESLWAVYPTPVIGMAGLIVTSRYYSCNLPAGRRCDLLLGEMVASSEEASISPRFMER